MNDYGLARAQAQYDAQEPPEPRDPRCECGERLSDHLDPSDLCGDPDALLLALQAIHLAIDEMKPIGTIEGIVHEALSLSFNSNRPCLKFVEADPDDGRY